MILFYRDTGEIEMISTWTLANPSTYQADGFLMIDGVGRRPIPDNLLAFPFEPDASAAMAALADAIQADEDGRYTIDPAGPTLLDNGQPVALDFVPGIKASAYDSLVNDPTIVAYFEMTDEELVTYVTTQFGYTAQQAQAWIQVRNVLRDLARATGLAKR